MINYDKYESRTSKTVCFGEHKKSQKLKQESDGRNKNFDRKIEIDTINSMVGKCLP